MKILIGTPIRDGKGYCIYEWLDSVKALEHQCDVLLVDNSDTEDFVDRVAEHCERIKLDIRILHLDNMRGKEVLERIALSHKRIQEKVLEGGYDYWFSLECDNIVPANALHILLTEIEGIEVVRHFYPEKTRKHIEVDGIGCALFKRKILEDFKLGEYGTCDSLEPQRAYSPDNWLYMKLWREKVKVKDLHNFLDIKHLQ